MSAALAVDVEPIAGACGPPPTEPPRGGPSNKDWLRLTLRGAGIPTSVVALVCDRLDDDVPRAWCDEAQRKVTLARDRILASVREPVFANDILLDVLEVLW